MNLDIKPKPTENVLYINDLSLANLFTEVLEVSSEEKMINPPDDNVRVYVPLDLSYGTLYEELFLIIKRYDGSATFKNEGDFCCDIDRWFKRLEIYDRVRFVRDRNAIEKNHCDKAVELGQLAVKELADCDNDGDYFPHNMIEEIETYFGFKK